MVELPTLLRLARRWYGDRLDPDWRPRTRDESQAILDEVGLTGDVLGAPLVDHDADDDASTRARRRSGSP